MTETVVCSQDSSSPRSTIFVAAPSMTTAVMNEPTISNTVETNKISSKDSSFDAPPFSAPEAHTMLVFEPHEAHLSAPPTPQQQHPEYNANYLHYPTPPSQGGGGGGGGYYLGYGGQMIPEPESPARGTAYETSFFPGAAFHATPFRYGKSPPAARMMTPTSPVLFPRVSAVAYPGAPPLPYTTLAAAGSDSAVYLGAVSHSSDEGGGGGGGATWNGPDSRNPSSYAHTTTPQGMQQQQQQMHFGMVTRATSGGRAYSFEGDAMLPPNIQDDPTNPGYSPYAAPNPNSGFAAWGGGGGYGGGDLYGAPSSPLQPRPTMAMIPPSPGVGMRPLYGANYAATSPGLPIQTTASNKGPDGANLFIFHIPNHYTNLDMYHLFLPYGNLLSVRIMVERETGRSRGFGFVSYDTPEAAAMAIKELNGFPIGNKRLKVQHKQIRRHDLQDDPEGSFVSGDFASGAYPSSGSSGNLWFDTSQNPIELREEVTPEAEESVLEPKAAAAVDTSQSTFEYRSNTDPVISSPLATLGELEDSLPSIPGAGGGGGTVTENHPEK